MNLQQEIRLMQIELRELKALLCKNDGQVLTAKAAAHFLGIPLRMLHHKSRAGNPQIPCTGTGCNKKFRKRDLVDWLKKNK